MVKKGSAIDLRTTETAIKLIKDNFEKLLAGALNLQRVSAPIIVSSDSGLNDNLSGTERVVSFDMANNKGVKVEIVQSLAKWKRYALSYYGFKPGEGLYTDMNAIRRDDDVDHIHSIYVDQWDWERVIRPCDRTLDFLKEIVKDIVDAICDTANIINMHFPKVGANICRDVYFITSEELLQMYPTLTPKQREYEITKKKKTVCVMQIGKILSNGQKHDGRAPDYDDWDLNCDILLWHNVLGEAIEISSMGIRVTPESLLKQLKIAGTEDRAKLSFHKALLNNELPLTIGGGIGQSRLCMLLLNKHHIGEVQASVWPQSMIDEYAEKSIYLL